LPYQVIPAFFPTHFNPNCHVVCYDNAIIANPRGKRTWVDVLGVEEHLVQDLLRSVDWNTVRDGVIKASTCV
jgi:hypothetical protein